MKSSELKAVYEEYYGTAKSHSQVLEILKRLSRNPGAMLGLFIFTTMILASLAAPLIAPYPYDEKNVREALMGPSMAHFFGTDELGRDIFSRVLYGTKYSVAIGAGAELFSLVGAVILGSIAGFFGGKVDDIVMRLCDVVQSVPGIILQIALCCVFGSGVVNTIIVLGIAGIAGGTRLMRSSILTVRKMEYLDAAESMNASGWQMIFRHILPNSFSPMIVHVTMNIGGRILSAASLSYLGLGIRPPVPELGAIISAGRDYIKSAPHITLIPGLCVMALVLSFNLFGDGLRDALDPKLKK